MEVVLEIPQFEDILDYLQHLEQVEEKKPKGTITVIEHSSPEKVKKADAIAKASEIEKAILEGDWDCYVAPEIQEKEKQTDKVKKEIEALNK